MARNILIKYDLNENLERNQIYTIDFNYNKCVQLVSLDYNDEECDLYLKSIDGHSVSIEYHGVSRADGMKLFVIDSKQVNRNSKIESLGL